MIDRGVLRHAREIVSMSDAVLVTAGAGMGVDSGLPDFRSHHGLWKAYPPLMDNALQLPQISNPTMFDTDPELAWGFFGHRHQLYSKTQPHEGFKLLLDLMKSKDLGGFVFTSNVDGQFQKAGFSEDSIHEVHGSIHYLQCTSACSPKIWPADALLSVPGFQQVQSTVLRIERKAFPRCPDCNALARPNILMFGDWTWVEKRAVVQEDNMEKWLRKIEQQKDAKLLIIEIGAGLSVPTVRYLSEMAQKRFRERSTLIRINPKDTDVPRGQISLDLGGLEALKLLLEDLHDK